MFFFLIQFFRSGVPYHEVLGLLRFLFELGFCNKFFYVVCLTVDRAQQFNGRQICFLLLVS